MRNYSKLHEVKSARFVLPDTSLRDSSLSDPAFRRRADSINYGSESALTSGWQQDGMTNNNNGIFKMTASLSEILYPGLFTSRWCRLGKAEGVLQLDCICGFCCGTAMERG